MLRKAHALPVALVAVSLPLAADEASTSAPQQLAPTVVNATRSQDSISETPYTAAVIDRETLDEQQFRTVPDAFSNLPGVLVQKTAYGHGSPFIRGYTGRNNLLLIDGIRANNSTWRSGPIQYWNTLDQESLESIELIKGQGSVLYGSDAIGGTANALSRSSGFRDETGFFNHGRLRYRFDTNSESHVGRIESRIGEGGKWGLTLGFTGKDFGDIKDSAVGRMRHLGYSEQAHDLKFELALSEDSTLTIAHQYINQDDVNRWHRTRYNPGWKHGNHIIPDQTNTGAASEIYDQERSLTYLRVVGSPQDTWFDTYSLTLSYQKSQDSTRRDRTNLGRSVDLKSLDLQTFGFDLQFESPMGPGNLLYGIDYYRDEVDSFAKKDGQNNPSNRPIADDSHYDLVGAFTQYQWQASDQLEITTGARYSYARASWGAYRLDGASEDVSGNNAWDDLSLSLRANYTLNREWSVYGGVSQAFRAPNLQDLTGNTYSKDGVNSSGSIDADPEEFLNYELGTRYQSDSLNLGLAAYYSDRQDQLTSVSNGSGGETSSNAGKGYVYGIEADATWYFAENWQARLFAAWQDGKIETPEVLGGPLVADTANRMHPLMGGASVRWTHPNQRLWIESRLKASATADNLDRSAQSDTTRIPAEAGTPSYAIVSLHAGYQFNDHLELTLGLENLLDDDYRYHGSGQNEAGTNAIIGITTSW